MLVCIREKNIKLQKENALHLMKPRLLMEPEEFGKQLLKKEWCKMLPTNFLCTLQHEHCSKSAVYLTQTPQ